MAFFIAFRPILPLMLNFCTLSISQENTYLTKYFGNFTAFRVLLGYTRLIFAAKLQLMHSCQRLSGCAGTYRSIFRKAWDNNRAIEPAFELRRIVLGKRLYVGNLAYSVDSSELERMFAAYGTVDSALVIEDRESGRSKGFGFVEMSTDDEANAAIQGLNGQMQNDRELTVNEARPRENRGGGGGGRGRY